MVKHCKFVLDGLLVFDILWCAHCSGVQIFDIFIEAYLPPASEVWEGYVITRVCHSVHGGWGVGSGGMCVWGGIPACFAGLQAHTHGGGWGEFYHNIKDLNRSTSNLFHSSTWPQMLMVCWWTEVLFFFYFIILAWIVSREGAEHHTLSNWKLHHEFGQI